MDLFFDFNEEDTSTETASKPIKIVKFRNGKRVVKWKCGEGYKYNPDTRRCIRISQATKRKMKLGAKKRVKAMRKKMNTILRKRARSLKIRQSRMGR